MTVAERYWWTMYLNASVFRVPHVIERLRREARQVVVNELSKPSAEFDALKGDAPEVTLLEWAINNHPGRLANSGMKILVNLLGNERAIDRIIHFRWFIRDLSSSSRRLLLGDDPFLRVNDLYRPGTLISIPLSPTRAFFGTDASDIANNIMNLGAREVVNRLNVETLRKAKRFVYGDAERSFIEKHLPLFTKTVVS